MQVHRLKTDPEVFKAVAEGKKTYEIRFDDRKFNVGDVLVLRETKYTGDEMKAGIPLVFTGREVEVKVSHILRGPIYGLMDGWVIMSITSQVNDQMFDAEAENRRAEQLENDCRWLIRQIEQIHNTLCPGQTGTWQDRVHQVVEAAKQVFGSSLLRPRCVVNSQPSALERELAEVSKWACCGEPERKVRAEHRIKQLEEMFSAFVGYVMSCRKENTDEWMEGLADAVNKICPAFNNHPGHYFNGDGLEFRKSLIQRTDDASLPFDGEVRL